MCRSNDFTSTSTQFVLFQSCCRQCCHRKLASSYSHALDSGTHVRGSGTYRISRHLRHNLELPGPRRIIEFLVYRSENERYFWLVMWTAGICTVLNASVLGQVVAVQSLPASRSKFSSSRDHTRPPRLSIALAMTLTMNARRFQRTHPLRGLGDNSLSASKDTGKGVADLATNSDGRSVHCGWLSLRWS